MPGLSGAGERDPWAASFGQLACCELERRLGAYPVDASAFWTPPEYWDADDIALEMSDAPNIWTGGSWEDFSLIGGFEVAGAGVGVPAPELAFECAVWECGGGVWGCSSGALPCFLCLSLGSCRLFSVLKSGMLLLLCSPSCLVTCWVNWQAVGPWLHGQTSAFGQRWRFGCSCTAHDSG